MATISDSDQKEFIQRELKVHNELRKEHCAEPLELDEELCKFALNYANYLAQPGVEWEHSKEAKAGKYGENLSLAIGLGSLNEATPSLDWYTEEYSNYKKYVELVDNKYITKDEKIITNQEFLKETGHFTQLIWKGNSKVGFGVAVGKRKLDQEERNAYFSVANYIPGGNLSTKEAYNRNVQLSTFDIESKIGDKLDIKGTSENAAKDNALFDAKVENLQNSDQKSSEYSRHDSSEQRNSSLAERNQNEGDTQNQSLKYESINRLKSSNNDGINETTPKEAHSKSNKINDQKKLIESNKRKQQTTKFKNNKNHETFNGLNFESIDSNDCNNGQLDHLWIYLFILIVVILLIFLLLCYI